MLTLFRPLNFLITLITGFIAVLIAENGELTHATLYFGVLTGVSAALIGAGGNIINDILDVEIDRINRPDRPLPAGKVTVTTATRLYIFSKMFGIFFAAMAGIIPALIAAASSFIIFFYSYFLKNIPLVGNFTVSVFTGMVFIFGASTVNNYSNALFPFIFAFMINMVREVVKDVEDIEGDTAENVRTFPVIFGVEPARKLAVIITLLLITVTFVPFLLQVYRIEYLVVIAVSVAPALISVIRDTTRAKEKKDWGRISGHLKLIMILGILAIIAGI
ncbi:MAG: hypothetical protein EDM75_02430 [Chlorobiota bacterium]|nr:MAG: hypothetical protein EDM75_02430 [Chlorobiota bacterium]